MNEINPRESESSEEDDEAEKVSYDKPVIVQNYFQEVIFGRNYPNFNKQFWCAFVIMLGKFGNGFFYGLYPKYMHDNDEAERKSEWPILIKLSWYFYPLGATISCVIMTYFGRQKALIFSYLPLWFSLYFLVMPNNYLALWMALLIMDVAVASSTVTNVVYITEIMEADLRGFFIALIDVFDRFGILLGRMFASYGHNTSWEPMVIVWFIFPGLYMIFVLAIPETPIWLLLNERPTSARIVFFWLHGYTAKSVEEFKKLIDYANTYLLKRNQSVFYNIFSSSFVKPLVIVTIMCTFKVLFVHEAVFIYGSHLLHALYWAETDDYGDAFVLFVISLIVFLIQMIPSITLAMVIHRLKRRPIFFISAVGTEFAFLMLIICSYNFLYENVHFDAAYFIVYTLFINFGVIPIPYIVSAEYFPQNLREYGALGALLYTYYWENRLAEEYEIMTAINPLYSPGLFWKLFFASLIVGISSYFIVPETEGLSLQELENKISRQPFTRAYEADDSIVATSTKFFSNIELQA